MPPRADLGHTVLKVLSLTAIRYVYVVLRIELGRALKDGHVQRNVATPIDPPTRERRERQPHSAEHPRAFLASVKGDRLEALYRLAIASGLRQGELLGLRYQDVDPNGSVLSVRHTLQQGARIHGARILAEPKTERSRRAIALDRDTVKTMREHRTHQLAKATSRTVRPARGVRKG